MAAVADETAEILDPFEEFSLAIDRFIERTRGVGLDAFAASDQLVAKQGFIDRLRLDFAGDAAEFAATEAWDELGSTTPIGHLTNYCHLTPGAAGGAICVGEQLPALQRSVESSRAGIIGYDHLVLMARTRDHIVNETSGVFDEAKLLRKAEGDSPHGFRRTCTHARHAADLRAFQRRQQMFADSQCLKFEKLGGDDGGWFMKGYFGAAAGAVIKGALEPLARKLDPTDTRDPERRNADAMVEMAAYVRRTGGRDVIDSDDTTRVQGTGEGSSASDGTRTTHCQVPQVQVTATLETLLGQPGAPAGELEGGVLVSSDCVQRLACSASVRRILLDPKGAVVDVGRARRVPAAPTRAAVETRDGGCVWPRCRRSVRWTDVHHVIEWARGGETVLANLVCLCWKHHDDVHLRGWRIVRVDGQREVLAIPPHPLEPIIRGPAVPAAA